MKLLITGGCGFLGSNLAAEALTKGIDLCIFDNLSRLGAVDNLGWLQEQGKFAFVHGDIRNENDVNRLIKKFNPDVVFHLAGQVAMTTSIANPRMDFEINAGGSVNLLEAVRHHAPSATIIYSSTNKVYGDLEQFSYQENETRYSCREFPKGFDETIGLNFSSPYGCSKGAADQYMLDYARIYGLKTIVFRHSSMYGGRQFSTYDQGWIGWFCEQAIESRKNPARKPFTISGNGKQVRDILHASDVTKLFFRACDRVDSIFGKAFNIGGGSESSLSLKELFLMLEKLTQESLRYTELSPRESDQKVFVADIQQAEALIGWKPKMDSEVGIASMLDWLSGQNLSE